MTNVALRGMLDAGNSLARVENMGKRRFKFGFFFALVLAACSVLAAVGYTPADYKGRDTAVAIWDGIDNTGTGVHDSSATTWTSLVGNFPLDLIAGNAEFSANALNCLSRSSGVAALSPVANSTTMRTYNSIEVSFDSAAKNTAVLWSSGQNYQYGRHFFLSSKGAAYLKTYPAAPYGKDAWDVGPCNVSGTYDQLLVVGAVYSNGVMCTMGTDKYNPEMYEYRNTGYPFVGGYLKNGNTTANAPYPFVGSIYAIRLNSRVLTQSEIAWNAHLDEARFNYGGNVHVLGFPEEYGTPSPAYGSTTQSDVFVTFSPGDLTRYDDGALAIPISDGRRACCLGYVRDGAVGVTNAVPAAPLALEDGMTIAWIWEKQCRVVAKATAECPSVSVNGVSGSCVTNWLAEGKAATVSAGSVPSGRAVVAWRGSGTGGATDAVTGNYTISVSAPLTVTPWTAAQSSLRFWRGATANAKTASNWRDWSGNAALPEDGSTVVLDAASGNVNLTWDLDDVTLANWVQDGYAGTVTFINGPGGTSGSTVNRVYGVLASDGVNRYVELTGDVLLSSGRWTHPVQPTAFVAGDPGLESGTGVWRLGVHAEGDIDIGPGALVTADGCGFSDNQGPGTRANQTVIGGAHGGRGGCATSAHRDEARPCYGDPRAPITVGSASANSRRGGGAIELKAGGRLQLLGQITADGIGDGGETSCYAGAGGSVWLTAGTLTGDGIVYARGAQGPRGGAGGGGHVAFVLTGENADFSYFQATVSAGCRTFDGQPATGTVYREKKSDGGAGELEIIGYGVMPLRLVSTDLAGPADYSFSKVTLSNGARLGVSAGATVRISQLVTDSKAMSGIALWGGTLVLPSRIVTDLELSVYRSGSRILFGADAEEGELEIGENCTFLCDAPITLSSLHVLPGGIVTHAANATDTYLDGNTSRYVRVQLEVTGNVTVDAGGAIDVSGRGYKRLCGPGAENGYGGSHGGLAYLGSAGKCYGSLTRPISFGSGATSFGTSYGGGALKLVCGGTLTVNGAVTASATHATGSIDTSPSGGSVWIETAELAGSGAITAEGGNCSILGRPGGGGRMAIALTRSGATFDAFRTAGGVISARGGYVSGNLNARYAGAGPVYLSMVDGLVTNATLVIDNEGVAPAAVCPTVIELGVTDLAVGSVLITNGGLLKVSRDMTLAVAGDFTNCGRFVAEDKDLDHDGGAIAFVDADRVSTITGTNTFANLICATPGKTLRFGTDAQATLTSISAAGRFTVSGEEGQPVYLRSTSDGTPWLLNMISGSMAAVSFADVKDSDAETTGGGSVAPTDSTDSGNNKNWKFSTIRPGDTITWTGASDGIWSTTANWDPERLPVDTDVVVIPADTDHDPSLVEPVVLNSLTVEDGAIMNLAGFSLVVTNILAVHGQLTCTGSERIELSGPSATLDAFACAQSEVVLSGGLRQTFSAACGTFNKLTVDKSGGSLAVSNGFTARKLTVNATGALSLAFAAGQTVRVDEFSVHGTDDARVTLTSTQEGVRWIADVAKIESVYGVNVHDAGASGISIYADAPATDLGNNAPGWVFGGRTVSWVGASGASFTNASSWSDGKCPDKTTRVVFDADARISLDAPALVRELKAEAGTAVIAPGTNELALIGSLSVENGATLSLNVPVVASNSVIVRTGGILTHEPMTALGLALTNRLCLTVGGDMTVEAGGAVDVTGKGFKNSCNNAGLGGAGNGPSHGGQGESGLRSYDSVFWPVHPGSSSAAIEPNTGAGGVVRIDIAGCLTLNGDLLANGSESTCYTCSGGSILVHAAHLAGSGRVQSNGSRCTAYSGYLASGGRIAFYLDDGDYATPQVTFVANGTCNRHPDTLVTSPPAGAAGTIYLADADEPSAGRLIVDGGNSALVGQYVQLPVDYGPVRDRVEDYRGVTLTVRNGGGVDFTSDLKLEELEYPSVNVSVRLNDHEIFINSTVHRNADRRPNRGWVTRAVEDRGAEGRGAYRWRVPGLSVLVR